MVRGKVIVVKPWPEFEFTVVIVERDDVFEVVVATKSEGAPNALVAVVDPVVFPAAMPTA
jgi:hypothetical protein